MKVVIDANIFISYLLKPSSGQPPAGVVRASLTGAFVTVFAAEIGQEIIRKVHQKSYLSARISVVAAKRFVELVEASSELVELSSTPFPAISRDRNDDFLLGIALASGADYIVSGDNDLLSLREHRGIGIVNASELLFLLAQEP
jgi:putative PIN family toxin of toxin-antitoxin system